MANIILYYTTRTIATFIISSLLLNVPCKSAIPPSNNSIPSPLQKVINQFKNCTIVLVSPQSGNNSTLHNSTIGPNFHLYSDEISTPIIIIGNQYIAQVLKEISLFKKRDTSQFCLTLVYPVEYNLKGSNIEGESNFDFSRVTAKIQDFFRNLQYYWVKKSFMQYIILKASAPAQHFLDSIEKYFSVDLKFMEILVLFEDSNTSGSSTSMSFRYYNKYSVSQASPWIRVECSLKKCSCFEKVRSVMQEISRGNKYFWNMAAWGRFRGPPYGHSWTERFTQINEIVGHSSNFDLFQIASEKSVTFDEFLSYLLLQDVLDYYANLTDSSIPGYVARNGFHFLNALGKIPYDDSFTPWDVILVKKESFNFLSCYKVSRQSDTASVLSAPFDGVTWVLLTTLLTAVTFVFLIVTKLLQSYNWVSDLLTYFILGVLWENSILHNFEKRMVQKRLSVKLVFTVYIFLYGTILTNLYKTSFTMETIVPSKASSPWGNLTELLKSGGSLKPFKFFIGIETLLSSLDLKIFEERDYLFLYQWNQIIDSNLPLSSSNSVDWGVLRNVTPLLYKEPAYFVNNLSLCDHVAYLDSSENVAKLVPFLNDNYNQIVFLGGKGSFLVPFWYGWQTRHVRNGYVWNRLKKFISSGIYSYWTAWFERVKPKKLFHQWANWTGTNARVKKLVGVKSKVWVRIYLFIGGVVICWIAFGYEIFTAFSTSSHR
ncbi:Membrane protein insertase YidC [Folsomia candida]|uniref:Membrane protein insertase YidC n=1 Tax=Folsomia candida TaxID=158441 RepID=A0A226DPE1_FOLCA|nr:Membrane protein insertase YidC [Folsomia candida]